jgi:hypothetical protein
MLRARVELLRHLERNGKMHAPGEQIEMAVDEATSMIAAGFAIPAGAAIEVDPRPIVGRFVPRAQ